MKLEEPDQNFCERPISEKEAKEVVKNMKNNKTPGTDGFPVEFYKFFWCDINTYLINSFNESFLKGELSVSQKQGIITCLPKGNKPREFLKNKRPISLLNTDYKILSGILAQRLKKVLPKVIGETQKGFLKDRYIGENIRLVYDIMSDLEVHNKKGLIILLDFEKAFDSLEWKYINKVLQSYSFGTNFIRWFNTLYNNSCSCVINNGYFSEFFQLARGCRQGDPLSPYIFILAIEPLAMEIKLDKEVNGVTIGNTNFKLGQYADDTFLFLDGSEASLRKSFTVFEEFYLCSGLKLNIDKTFAVWLGSMKLSNETLCHDFNLKWAKSFTLLGVDFNVDKDKMVAENYNSKLNTIEKIIHCYKKRKLSLIGKVTVLKTLIVPKLVHIMQVLPSPTSEFLKRMEIIFKLFLWDDKKPRITLAQLEKDIQDGGLKLTKLDFLDQALKMTWINNLIKRDGSWQHIFEHNIAKNKKEVWLLDVVSLKKLKNTVQNVFWRDVFKSWITYKENFSNEINVRTYPIWNSYFLQNRNILLKKENFEQKGLHYINDLLTNSGELMGYNDFQNTYRMKINFVDFYSLIHSIPRKWMAILRDHRRKIKGPIFQPVLNELLAMPKVCKGTYWKLISTSDLSRNIANKWSEHLGKQFTNEDMRDFFTLNFQCTIESKMRSFQYKILQRILTTNKFLNICGIKADKCYFCGIMTETLEHLFWECPKITQFWKKMVKTLEPYINLYEILNCKSILLGVRLGQNETLVNHLINIIKRYIYVVKCNGNNLCVEGALEKVKETFKIEQNIVRQQNKKFDRIETKWAPLLQILDA